MRKSVVCFLGAVMLTSFAGTALADAGGAPNSNAIGPGSGVNGRKANCVPPGMVLSTTAKLPGPNNDPAGDGLSPGQEVVSECGLGPS
jgi:hypothetical protein